METIAVGLLMAFAGSTASSAGQQAWQSLRRLVTRSPDDGEEVGGRRELEALGEEPGNEERARALADALAVRAERDTGFAQRLRAWQEREARAGAGDVRSTVSGTVNGPVVMGRDFNGPVNLG